MPTERVTFPGSTGAPLAGRLELPAAGRPRGWALFAHCFTCSKDLSAAVALSRSLAERGFATLRFDFTGIGESEGDFAGTTFRSNVADLVAAGEYLTRAYEAPTLLVGHSLGGAAVLRAAAAPALDSVAAVCTVAAPFDPAHAERLFAHASDSIAMEGAATVEIAGRRFTITREFLEDLRADRSTEVVAGLGRPLLICHSPIDQVVGIDNAALLFEAARHPRSFVSLDRADHLLSDPDDAAWVAAVIAAWAGRYAEAPADEETETPPERTRLVASIGTDRYRTTITTAGGHTIVADEPEHLGGTDQGPSPYDLIAGALGACTAITLRMYADRKGWPLEGVRVELTHRRLHAPDGAACPDRPARLDRMERTVEVDGPLSEEQRGRLLEIADRCPVHRTLSAGVGITAGRRDGGTAGGSAGRREAAAERREDGTAGGSAERRAGGTAGRGDGGSGPEEGPEVPEEVPTEA